MTPNLTKALEIVLEAEASGGITDAYCEMCQGSAPQAQLDDRHFRYAGPVRHRPDCALLQAGAVLAQATSRS